MTPAGQPVTGDPELDEWMYLCRMIGQFTGAVLQDGYILPGHCHYEEQPVETGEC